MLAFYTKIVSKNKQTIASSPFIFKLEVICMSGNENSINMNDRFWTRTVDCGLAQLNRHSLQNIVQHIKIWFMAPWNAQNQ